MRLMNAPDMNRLVLSGMVEAAPSFSHTTRGEDFLHLPLYSPCAVCLHATPR